MTTPIENAKAQSGWAYHIAIIGLGPKGLYALERLLAQIGHMALGIRIHIHVFNRNKFFGAGDVYRCDQPSYLIMNYANKNINAWSDEMPKGLADETLTFTEWLSKRLGIATASLQNRFAPRAEVGFYLMDAFGQMCRTAPENVTIIPHVNVVIDIDKRRGGFHLKTKNKTDKLPMFFEKILLTTGHVWNGARFASQPRANSHIDFIYPTDKKLNRIPQGAKVAIKGMGLTFIDAVLALTEGRGGGFGQGPKGKYIYIASGNEPKALVPFSRTGLPMIPRNSGDVEHMHPYFLTEERIKGVDFSSPVHFEHDILPLIKKEFLFHYYQVLFKSRNRELLFHSNFADIQKQIDGFHRAYQEDGKFDWNTVENPFEFSKGPRHEDLLEYMGFVLHEAEKGMLGSPLIAAVGSWRKLSAVFNRIYSYGGLDAASHRLFDRYYFAFFNRIAYGPPIANAKKILALAEYGILNFHFAKNPEIDLLPKTDSFRVQSNDKENEIRVDWLIDARIPKGHSDATPTGLFYNLLRRGIIRYFENEDDIKYKPGCIDIDHKGRPLDREGNIDTDMTFYGTPTEGITFDNDTLSRKRNNFASQWAFDLALDIKRSQESKTKIHDRAHELLSR